METSSDSEEILHRTENIEDEKPSSQQGQEETGDHQDQLLLLNGNANVAQPQNEYADSSVAEEAATEYEDDFEQKERGSEEFFEALVSASASGGSLEEENTGVDNSPEANIFFRSSSSENRERHINTGSQSDSVDEGGNGVIYSDDAGYQSTSSRDDEDGVIPGGHGVVIAQLQEEEAMEDGPFHAEPAINQHIDQGNDDSDAETPHGLPLDNSESGRLAVGDTEEEESSEEEATREERPEPAVHSYLGHIRDVTVAGDRMLPEDAEVELPVLSLEGVVLFPGETLPLRLTSPSYIDLVQKILNIPAFLRDTPAHLGIINRQRTTQQVGTTAEIRSGQLINSNEMALKCTGRQRFRMIKSLGYRQGAVPFFQVRVLKDASPVPQTAHLQLPRQLRLTNGRVKFDIAACQNWVYRLHSPHHLMKESKELLRTKQAWDGIRTAVLADENRETSNRLRRPSRNQQGFNQPYGSASEDECKGPADTEEPIEEQDPLAFSFWLGANLPLTDSARQQLLAQDSLFLRLRAEKKHLQTSSEKKLCCIVCEQTMTSKASLFTLSGAEGVVGAYVNPHGVVHQTLTLREMERGSTTLIGRPTAEDTWFPGYAWTIANCSRCYTHLGWRFTAISKRTTPRFFWGIRRSALQDEEVHGNNNRANISNRMQTIAQFMAMNFFQRVDTGTLDVSDADAGGSEHSI